MNTFGKNIAFTDFGESHGPGIGGVLDGIPANLAIDYDTIRINLRRRAGFIDLLTGQYASTPCPFVSPRSLVESDHIEWLSGVLDGLTLGSPIAFFVKNTAAASSHYEPFEKRCRPGHADWTYEQKYKIRDWRGGGRASARETVTRVIAGSIVQPILAKFGIDIRAKICQIGNVDDPTQFEATLEDIRNRNDSVGAIVQCEVKHLPIGLGEPIFDKLQSRLAFGIMSINGCKGFDYGSGFASVEQTGRNLYQNAPSPFPDAGGIEGGLSNGLPLLFRCVFKPTSSIITDPAGRHDTCIAIRALPVVEAMTALVLTDFLAPAF